MKSTPGQSDLLQATLEHAQKFLDDLDDAPVAPVATLAELRERLNRDLPSDPCAAREVIDQLVNDTAGGLTHNQGGRFFAWVIGGSLPAALAADWLTSTWDQNSGMFSVAPAAAVVSPPMPRCVVWVGQV
jgi:glutamate/tyrosine decarboxylase-like PLP-dependent enzyme